MPLPRRTAVALLGLPVALLAASLAQPATAQAFDDPAGDADGVLDVESVTVTFGNGTLGLLVRFDPGEVPGDRAVRGVVLIGTAGAPEPSEWYQVTIANQTTVYAAHGDQPRVADLVATSWTGDLASAEWRRDAPATGECTFAVVEAGTMDATGFVRSDVAPPGFASPEEAWPVEECPSPAAEDDDVADDPEEKGSPALPLVGLLAALALALSRRR